MKKNEFLVETVMTKTPLTIALHENVAKADSIMQEKSIRHLPVVDKGKVVGILSDRDVALALGIGGIDVDQVKVSDVFSPNLFSVTPKSPINDVLDLMIENKVGSVLVMRDEELLGIYTDYDALKAYRALLKS